MAHCVSCHRITMVSTLLAHERQKLLRNPDDRETILQIKALQEEMSKLRGEHEATSKPAQY